MPDRARSCPVRWNAALFVLFGLFGYSFMACVSTTYAGDAEAFATALAASTYQAATDLLGRMRKVEAALLIRDGESLYLLASASLRGRLQLEPDFEAEIGGDVRYLLPPVDFPAGPA